VAVGRTLSGPSAQPNWLSGVTDKQGKIKSTTRAQLDIHVKITFAVHHRDKSTSKRGKGDVSKSEIQCLLRMFIAVTVQGIFFHPMRFPTPELHAMQCVR
jgi:hypothetical protein